MTIIIYEKSYNGCMAAWCLSLSMDNTTTTYQCDITAIPIGSDVIFIHTNYSLINILVLLQQVNSITYYDNNHSVKPLDIITDIRFKKINSDCNYLFDCYLDDHQINCNQIDDHQIHWIPANDGSVGSDVSIIRPLVKPWFINVKNIKYLPNISINKFFTLIDADIYAINYINLIITNYNDDLYNLITKHMVKTTYKSFTCYVVNCPKGYEEMVNKKILNNYLCDYAISYHYNIVLDCYELTINTINDNGCGNNIPNGNIFYNNNNKITIKNLNNIFKI